VTYTLEQNGVAEKEPHSHRNDKMPVNPIRTATFWEEAVNTANYIRNRCSSSSLNGKTAEKWTSKAPDVRYFREFGCKVYALDRSSNKSKFNNRSKEDIFISYSKQSKSYRVWIPEERRIDITRE